MSGTYDVVVIGAGAAGIGAGRRLKRAGVSFIVLEARDRVGGRAHTMAGAYPLDLGCEWLHSGDINVMTATAEASGFHVERAPAPWTRQTGGIGTSDDAQVEFRRAFAAFEKRIDDEAELKPPVAASAYLEPGGKFNALIDAIFSYISGASLDHIDARDYARYQDTGCNWRVREGYGALFAALAAELPVRLETEVQAIAHGGATVRVRTSRGEVETRSVIVTLPTGLLARLTFEPDLPAKRHAALGLPLGTAEKVHFALADAEEFPDDGHLFPRFDAADMGSYHLRPLGRPLIEAYFGGRLARSLAEAGSAAMDDFARQELAGLLGSAFPKRLTTLATTHWATEPYSLGSYSYAEPGFAEERQVLAAPEGRVFFAGEACSKHRYSTAHGAFETGFNAAGDVLALLGYEEPSPRA